MKRRWGENNGKRRNGKSFRINYRGRKGMNYTINRIKKLEWLSREYFSYNFQMELCQLRNQARIRRFIDRIDKRENKYKEREERRE
jgi:hypothetical protein